jgi:hypothetical protein
VNSAVYFELQLLCLQQLWRDHRLQAAPPLDRWLHPGWNPDRAHLLSFSSHRYSYPGKHWLS